jgi:very-short-patch-repair endonuclease
VSFPSARLRAGLRDCARSPPGSGISRDFASLRLSQNLRELGFNRRSAGQKEFTLSSFESRSKSRRKSVLAERAQHMRHAATSSEVALWSALRGGALGAQFRRQVPIGGNFIGDFVASTIKLVVEVDGNWHVARGTADARRDRELQRLGFTVLRLSVAQVERQLPVVVNRIRNAIAALRGTP